MLLEFNPLQYEQLKILYGGTSTENMQNQFIQFLFYIYI